MKLNMFYKKKKNINYRYSDIILCVIRILISFESEFRGLYRSLKRWNN